MTYKQIIGDIFNSKEKYLVHQTNCISRGASGIARLIFDKFPYSNCYQNRNCSDIPGTNKIFGNGIDQRFVVNMMAQYAPGKIDELSRSDKAFMRHYYFHNCLIELAKVENLKSVVFPAGIGCDIAGGNWEVYLGEIKEFYYNVNKTQKVDVSVYCLESNVNKFNFIEI